MTQENRSLAHSYPAYIARRVHDKNVYSKAAMTSLQLVHNNENLPGSLQ